MNSENSRSIFYNSLTQESKEKVDAILSLLDGMNTHAAKKIAETAERELDFRSVVNITD